MHSSSALDDGEDSARGKPSGKTLSLSAPAAAHIREYLDREGKSDVAVRVAAVPTHCMGGRGYGYVIREDIEKPYDMLIESEGVKLLVDPQSMRHLSGTSIEYEESVQGSGLAVHNPNAVAKCHCGRHDLFEAVPSVESGGCH